MRNREPVSAPTIPFVADSDAFEQLVIETLKQHTQAFDEVKHEVVAVGSVAQRTLEQATRTNGRVNGHDEALARMLERLAALEHRNRESDIAANARQQQRSDDREKVRGVLDWVKEAWPLVAGVAIAVTTFWAALAGFFA